MKESFYPVAVHRDLRCLQWPHPIANRNAPECAFQERRDCPDDDDLLANTANKSMSSRLSNPTSDISSRNWRCVLELDLPLEVPQDFLSPRPQPTIRLPTRSRRVQLRPVFGTVLLRLQARRDTSLLSLPPPLLERHVNRADAMWVWSDDVNVIK